MGALAKGSEWHKKRRKSGYGKHKNQLNVGLEEIKSFGIYIWFALPTRLPFSVPSTAAASQSVCLHAHHQSITISGVREMEIEEIIMMVLFQPN